MLFSTRALGLLLLGKFHILSVFYVSRLPQYDENLLHYHRPVLNHNDEKMLFFSDHTTLGPIA